MHAVSLGDRVVHFEIKRGRRKKSLAIIVDPKAGVVVLAPGFLSEEKIRTIVQDKARWIIGKQDLITQRSLTPRREFVSGETFLYLGRCYPLEVARGAGGQQNPCRLVHGRLRVEIPQPLEGQQASLQVKKALLRWYREHADKKIRERTARLAQRIGKWPQSVEVKEHKARWGSCSPAGVLRFNWKIIMAPRPVVDYVIVHELCHLIHLQHSRRFWQRVQSILPDYRERRAWLGHSQLLWEEAP